MSVLFAAAIGSAFASVDETTDKPPALNCEIGPLHKEYGGTPWLVYACDDARSAVVVADEGNSASPFYFIVYIQADGSMKVYGEGNGKKSASAAAFGELKKLTRTEVAALVTEARSVHANKSTEPDRRIAVTIDDLPWARLGDVATPDLQARHEKLIASLRLAKVPIVGFVNEKKLEVDGKVQPQRVAMLRDWLDAGFELGNHTWSHADLHAVGVEAYEKEILDGERQLRPLLAEYKQKPRWFRHPYLRAGQTAEDKRAVVDFLAEHGYRVAPVTVDNGEWVWAFAYANVMNDPAHAGDRERLLERLREGYVPYMLAKLDYYEAQSRQLLGYALPQVWLMHANELNADSFVALVDGARRRGYRFIALEEAMKDPAYERPDGYTGRWGPSWLHRWAMAEKKPKEFYAGEPLVPQWVLDLAGVESE